MTTAELKAMKVGDEVRQEIREGLNKFWLITRVPDGWIYVMHHVDSLGRTNTMENTVYVPELNPWEVVNG